jgi:Mrp family chromosome partitioning ATPase
MMSQKVSEEVLYQALTLVNHPKIQERNLVDLGMIPEIRVVGNRVQITLALPFPNTSVEQPLIALIRGAIAGVNAELEVDVSLTEMDPKQRAAFVACSRGDDPATVNKAITHVVAIVSGKGGVGKSSVAGLLASALRCRGFQVGILDADITGPSIPMVFGAHQPPTAGPEGIRPVESRTGIKLMSINLLLSDENQPVVWRGPLISRAIQQFWSDIAWGNLDYLIVDLPPGTSDAALTVTQSLPLDGIVLVTSPQDLAGMVVRKAANMARHLGVPLIGLVENMSHAVCPHCGATIDIFGPSRAEETAQQIGTKLLGRIPLDATLAVLCDAGTIENYHCDEFEAIAEAVIEFVPRAPRAPGSSHSPTGMAESRGQEGSRGQ